MKKVKILFVTSQFSQGGAERYLYEICKHLDKTHFYIEILTVKNANHDFYYHKLKYLGVTVHELCIRRHLVSGYLKSFPAIARVVSRILTGCYNVCDYKVARFLKNFDVISVIQIENYYHLVPYHLNNMLIHLVSHQVQYGERDIYSLLNKKKRYHFVTMDDVQKDEVIQSKGDIDSFFYWPLALDLNQFKKINIDCLPHRQIKIGVFTRVSPEKPLDAFFEAFKELRVEVDATLHVYGRGNHNLYRNLLNNLQIKKFVVFEGHCEDMNNAVVNDGLSLCWMLSLNDTIGYAAIELAAAMMPVIFWNLGNSSLQEILRITNNAVHSYNDVKLLSDASVKALSDRSVLISIAKDLHSYTEKTWSIQRKIASLENKYLEVYKNNKGLDII